MSAHTIPQGIDLHVLQLAVMRAIGKMFTYDGNSPTPPTAVLFTPDLTAEEISAFDALVEKLSAENNLQNLPNWATWTAAEAEANIANAIFSGASQTQIDAQIDTLPNTVAGMKTGLKSMAAAILSIRAILVAMGKAIIYLRNLAIR